MTVIHEPISGRDFGLLREVSGLSLRAVAHALGVHFGTLARWEAGASPVAPQRAAQWREALQAAAQLRVAGLEVHGWPLRELRRRTEMGRVLAWLTAPVSSPSDAALPTCAATGPIEV
jgi:transcriptional regulator with XRE-family HTH domain